ncbi:hypothetical protein LWI28_011825 [Acer negundo]|uniref:Uncharacterized protein n=1 Tax=Acer negundo TaxID=4023 RepID=A0AAD5JKA8_ACENE|nr:hypothetical protein LWI28_011274 [Acer negundo]KAI9195112.1 hypothetical protein LWI28_011825 [Acer negundo]KAK4855255.1 hypothetical protein QYF36_005464 [Acer negundo]
MPLNLKSLLFVSLVTALVAAPIAEIRLLQLQGSVFCTPDGNILVNGTATPVFPMVYCPRGTNQFADNLARKGAGGGEEVRWSA